MWALKSNTKTANHRVTRCPHLVFFSLSKQLKAINNSMLTTTIFQELDHTSCWRCELFASWRMRGPWYSNPLASNMLVGPVIRGVCSKPNTAKRSQPSDDCYSCCRFYNWPHGRSWWRAAWGTVRRTESCSWVCRSSQHRCEHEQHSKNEAEPVGASWRHCHCGSVIFVGNAFGSDKN